MKKLLILFFLAVGLTLAQTSNNVVVSTTIKGDTTGGKNGTVATPIFNKYYGYDLMGIYYPVMDSSSQFVLYGKIKLTHQTYSDTLELAYRDSNDVKARFAVDSTKSGYIGLDKVETGVFDQFWLTIPDTVENDKTFYWIMQERKK